MTATVRTTDLQPSRVDEAPVPAPVGSEPCLDDRELRAWRGLLRAHAALTKALDSQLEQGHGLPLMSYEVLMQLNDAEERRMRMRDLATSVILSRSGLTRLVDRLEAEGLLRRESCPSDARGAFAVLTDAGAEKLRAARATHLAGVRSMFLAHFEDAELDALGDAWERVVPGATNTADGKRGGC